MLVMFIIGIWEVRVAMLRGDLKVIVKCKRGEVITWANQDTDSLGARSTRHT